MSDWIQDIKDKWAELRRVMPQDKFEKFVAHDLVESYKTESDDLFARRMIKHFGFCSVEQIELAIQKAKKTFRFYGEPEPLLPTVNPQNQFCPLCKSQLSDDGCWVGLECTNPDCHYTIS